jgi:hypothetical protein
MSIAQKEHEQMQEMMEKLGVNQRAVESRNNEYRYKINQTIQFAEESYKVGIEKAISFHKHIKAPGGMIETLEQLRDKRVCKFLKWVEKESNHKYYIAHMSNDGAVGLWTRDFKAMFVVKMCWSNESVDKALGSNQRILDVESIHSFQKGEGYKIMKNILAFGQRHSLPVTLWTETEQNVKYFERYGFKNYGRCGINQEYLMILKNK